MRHFYLVHDVLDKDYCVVYYNDRTHRSIFVGDWQLNFHNICNMPMFFCFDATHKRFTDLDHFLDELSAGSHDRTLLQLPSLPYPEMIVDYPELLI